MLNDWKPDLKSQARIVELEGALRQSVMELREAAKISEDANWPRTARAFALAADRKEKLLEVSNG